MVDLFFIGVLLLVAYYWSSSMKAREIAFTATVNHCRKMNLLLLDDYVALNAQWLKKDEYGVTKVWRSFQFEFSSTGDERYQGKIIMLGEKILSIQLDPYRIQE